MVGERVAAVVSLLLVGCGTADSGPNATLVTDSAGIEVVQVPLHDVVPILIATPALQIGVVSGDPDYEFGSVGGALILPNGERVVADGRSSQLRFFDADGAFLRAVGRRGEGPGEFERFGYMGLLGSDTLVVYDRSLLRLNLLSLDGRFIRSSQIQDAALPWVAGAMESGTIIAWQFAESESNELGPFMNRLDFGTVETSESRFEVLGQFDGVEEGQIENRGRVVRAFRPFAREGDVAAGGDRIYVLSGSAGNRIEVWDSERLVRVIALDLARTPTSANSIENWVESWMEVFPPDGEGMEEWLRTGFRELGAPDSVPLLRSLEVDANGDVCAELYPLVWGGPTRLLCFSPEGGLVRQIELPAGRAHSGPHPFWDPPIQILEDRVIGVWSDELGVETIREFALSVDPR